MNDDRVFIMDMYNFHIYPRDHQVKGAIRCRVELDNHTDDKTYLRLLHVHLENSLNVFQPNLVVYNAGTDILRGDPLGNLDISSQVDSLSFCQNITVQLDTNVLGRNRSR